MHERRFVTEVRLLTGPPQCHIASFMTCNHQLRVCGNRDDGRGDRETKQQLKRRREKTDKKKKGWTEAGHFTAHTSHNRN